MSYLVVANATAGGADDEAVDAAAAKLREHTTVDVARTASPDELNAALDALEGRTLIVAGGDGSLHLVVDRLRQRGQIAEATLGLIPLGTGNDLARGIGIPLEPAEAAAAITHGRARLLDLLADDAGGVVVNAAHAGLGAEAAATATGLKKVFGPVSYPLGALIEGVRETGWALEVVVDGEVLAKRYEERGPVEAGVGERAGDAVVGGVC